MAPKHSVEVLSSIPKNKKAVMRFMPHKYVLDKLCVRRSYSAVVCVKKKITGPKCRHLGNVTELRLNT